MRLAVAFLCGLSALCLPGLALGADSGTCPAPTVYTGAGTSGDPLAISTPGQLQKLRDTSADWSKVIRLTADIGMGGCTWGSTFGPTPVGFSGTFDGGGHVVSGLDITISNSSYAGFIGDLDIGGVVKDLGFAGNVTGISDAGSSSDFVYAGGLVGFTLGSTSVLRSWASGAVTGVSTATSSGDFGPGDDARADVEAGGLIGRSQGTVADVYALGSVVGTTTATGSGGSGASSSTSVGGLIGSLGPGSLVNAYAMGTPSGTATATDSSSVRIGGLVGVAELAAATARWDLGAWAGSGSGGGTSVGTGVAHADLSNYVTFGPAGANWNISDGYSASSTWGMCPALRGGVPFLTVFVTAEQCVQVPNVPATPPAVAGDGKATVTVAGGTGSGEAPVTFLVTAVEDSTRRCTVTAPATSCDVTGLTNGTSYTFIATATNTAGTSGASSPSLAVTPRAAGDAGTTGTSTTPLRLPTTVTRTSNAVIITFTASGPGVVSQLGMTIPGRRGSRATALKVCTVTRTIAKAGPASVTCNLANAVRRLRSQQALTIRLTTTFTPVSGVPEVSTRIIRLERTPVPATPTIASTTPSSVTG